MVSSGRVDEGLGEGGTGGGGSDWLGEGEGGIVVTGTVLGLGFREGAVDGNREGAEVLGKAPDALLVWIGEELFGGSILKFSWLRGTVFPDLRFTELEDTVGLEAEAPRADTATVLGTGSFATGRLDLAVCNEKRLGLGEEEPRGGKGSSGSGGSGGWGGGRGLSPEVKHGGDGAEALLCGNQGFAIYCFNASGFVLFSIRCILQI